MRGIFIFVFIASGLLLTACKPDEPVCEPGTITYQKNASVILDRQKKLSPEPTPETENIEINGRLVSFDQVLHGPLCNNILRGKVYVACDIEIVEWNETPNFYDGCEFTVEPNAIVYVAAHNNEAFYNGCNSCHMTDEGE